MQNFAREGLEMESNTLSPEVGVIYVDTALQREGTSAHTKNQNGAPHSPTKNLIRAGF